MHHFTAHRLRFEAQARSAVELNEHQGSAIRGALFHALRRRFCGMGRFGGNALDCGACPLVSTCPVATLVSTVRPGALRGQDVPRPYSVQPPLGDGDQESPVDPTSGVFRYRPGSRLEFGLSLYANAVELFPYVVLAMSEFEAGGIGRKAEQIDGRWERGRLSVEAVWAENPLTGERELLRGPADQYIAAPDLAITHDQVLRVPQPSRHAPVTLHLLTPMRLVQHGHLIKPEDFRFQPFFQRLLERLEALSAEFSDTPLRLPDAGKVIAAADDVHTVQRGVVWEEVDSYSTRRRASSPIGGLLGSATFAADDWAPFWPWLVWGAFTHVGKDAVKGNGWYRLEA